MLAIAMTLIAGAAAWGFVNSQAGVSEGALQNNAVATNDMLSEHFSVADMYFGTTTSATFLIYNTGSLTFQIQSVRFYDSAGLVNLYYNSTGTGASKADKVYDLKSSLATKCKTAGTTYESPSLTADHAQDDERGVLHDHDPAHDQQLSLLRAADHLRDDLHDSGHWNLWKRDQLLAAGLR